ncbi:ABC exporter membrane fusion protein, DevB family [Cylindrospermum stagnale PCC 7417]|uniref:ABC exporter membrane fusion protein, DevB family n=1 Tax=Cylindrospermum stagnale PCC 7417 TaxID=56107 RepID=K9WUB3_9NOST|nr:ABC exporter membrane fusion protein [Cylindrospermum stagnale]AFZ23376.1 ABC exporter membrane fusion protein, DevB family [Cylindrospermum stagnale PCC 7417]
MQNPKLQGSLSLQSILRPPIIIVIIASLTVIGISVFTGIKFRDAAHQKAQAPGVNAPELKTVTSLGRIEPQGEVIKLSAAVSGTGSRVEELLVKEGDRVKVGQVIAILDNRDRLQAALTEAQAQVKVAQANLARIQAGVKRGEINAQIAKIARLIAERQGDIDAQFATIGRLKAQVLNAQAEDQRYQRLYAEGAISASQQDSKRLTLETAQKSLQEAQVQLKRTQLTSQQQVKEATATLEQISEVRGVDVATFTAEVGRATAAMNQAKANLKQAYVRSPLQGQIFEIHTRPGELISNDGIADIGQTSQMYAVAEVYESDISKVRIGQRVRVVTDVLSVELPGTVDQIGLQVRRQSVINTDPSSNIDNRVVKVHIRLDNASSQKAANLTNMQVKVVIEL